jgi:hypothetical protein
LFNKITIKGKGSGDDKEQRSLDTVIECDKKVAEFFKTESSIDYKHDGNFIYLFRN